MKSFHYALLAATFIVRQSSAQAAARESEAGRRAVASDSILTTITETEARANRPVARAPHDTVVASMIERYEVGSTARRCVDATTAGSARSGDFVVGGFGTYYSDNWYRGYGKLAWNMVSGSLVVPPMLVVRASRVDGPGDARVWEIEPNRHPPGGPVFYPSGIHVPSTGRWMFVATAGDAWGCFLYTLR